MSERQNSNNSLHLFTKVFCKEDTNRHEYRGLLKLFQSLLCDPDSDGQTCRI